MIDFDRVPMPDAPVTAPWDCSLACLLAPRGGLPPALARFGAVHLSPLGIGFDSADATPWDHVREVRTRPLRLAVTGGLAAQIGAQAARLAPPGTRFAVRRLSARLAEAAAGLLGAAVRDGAEVPFAVVARTRWRSAVLAPSAAASALLWLPAVAESVLATAGERGVPVVRP